MRALEGLRGISVSLNKCGIEEPYKEAVTIVSEVMGLEKVSLYRDNPLLSSEQEAEIREAVERRWRGEPLQYIIGFVDFCGLKIKVGPGVLIPRPESELIVEKAIKTVDGLRSRVPCEGSEDIRRPTGDRGLRILDLCTGSGCLALALARGIPESYVFGTDISEEALDYAVMNAEINGIINAVFVKGDLYEPLDCLRFDLVVSNPPYIRKGEIADLAPEIREWEPVSALDGGEDGIFFYRSILDGARDHLAEEGSLILEMGHDEAGDVTHIAHEAGFRTVSLVKDYAGIERVLHLKMA